MAFVLDASAALSWCFRDEATPASEKLLSRAASGERIFVAAHWPLEVLNALTRASRRGRTDDPANAQFLNALLSYNIEVVVHSLEEEWAETGRLVLKHRLSAYDAAYLALALRLQVALATLDERLQEAARAENVALA